MAPLIPIPGVGTAVGTALGSAVSKALEMELAGLNPEDREFGALRIVRLAGETAQQAAMAQPNADPLAAAKAAVMTAVQQQPPGVLRDHASRRLAPQHCRAAQSQRKMDSPRPHHHFARSLEMTTRSTATWLLAQEACALLTRLARVKLSGRYRRPWSLQSDFADCADSD